MNQIDNESLRETRLWNITLLEFNGDYYDLFTLIIEYWVLNIECYFPIAN